MSSKTLDGFRHIDKKPLRMLRPVPVYLLITGSLKDNEVNVMALSWLTPISKNPPTIGVVVDKSNYSHKLIIKYRWFSLAIIDISKAELAKYVGTYSKREVDKILRTNMIIIPWPKNREIPITSDALGILVCEVKRVIDFKSSTLFVAKVLDAYAKEGFFDETRGWNLQKAQILLHKSKHTFVKPSSEEKHVTKTPWGIAVKKPWRKLFD